MDVAVERLPRPLSSQVEEEQLIPAPSAWFDEEEACDVDDDDEHSEGEGEEASVDQEEEEHESVSSDVSSSSKQDLMAVVGAPMPSPSWREISSQVLPSAARELLSSSLHRVYYTARLSYAKCQWQRKYSDLNNDAGGFFQNFELPSHLRELPPVSSLPWIDRQLVKEWRTYRPNDEDEETEFDCARTLVPMPLARPKWQRADACHRCNHTFGPSRLRHHCRLCGNSFCHAHSNNSHKLPHLGYEPSVPERVCDSCKGLLMEQNLAERIAWRLARCRDYSQHELVPYFETGVDTVEDAALRVTQAALAMARSIPLGAQATVAVETVDVLRKYGLNGIYTIMLRQEFLAAADLLRKALGINQTAWPLSVHELSAAIFYALAQHRAMRGMNPELEHWMHTFRESTGTIQLESDIAPTVVDGTSMEDAAIYQTETADISKLVSMPTTNPTATLSRSKPFQPVCDPLPDHTLSSLIFYAPVALNFIYALKPVDMQLLAAQQGWRLLYAYLEQDTSKKAEDRPASALFLHEEQKIACLAVRGTTTIHDVITDIRQVPVPFPDIEGDASDDDWTTVFKDQGVAVCGMAAAAVNLYREHVDSILYFAKQGYRIRLTGHSLGGGVATLLGVLIYRDMERQRGPSGSYLAHQVKDPLRVYAFGTPSCVDVKLAQEVESFVTTVVLHDDVIPRLTPSSCRGLLKHLLHIRETWVKEHLPGDLMAIRERARTVWAPRWRQSFTLPKSSSSIKRYCRKQLQYGKKKLRAVKEKLVGEDCDDVRHCCSRKSVLSTVDETSTEYKLDEAFDSIADESQIEDSPVPHLLLDYMGGMDSSQEGLVVDGDEFFDPYQSLVENSDGEESDDEQSQDGADEDHDLAQVETGNESTVTVEGAKDGEEDNDSGPEAVVLEETPLPRMFIPGKVVHVYSHRGVYRAAFVPRTFRELRRISLAGNMLSDHKTKDYFEALLEVRSVRKAEEDPPRWTAFDEDDTCSCCASRFTWASTSDSAAQEARDKHNCRSCGTLVCDPCSRNRIPLPSIGLTVSTRVCDRCYNDISGLSSTPSAMASSFIEDGDETVPDDQLDKVISKPERQRERRSAVVDDLASRVEASGLQC